jgi:hypothetical protein
MSAPEDKAHATWSASATERLWACAGGLALTKDLPEQTSEAADWGTCCHEIGELCLTRGVEAAEFIGTTLKGKEHEFEVDDEMADTAQQYVDYVRDRQLAYRVATDGGKATLYVERKFSLDKLGTPFDAGGTGDAVIYFPEWALLEVIDLKGGRGVVVEAKGNPQLKTYGLGAVLEFPKLPVEQIVVTIVQPRAGHKDGRIRSETFHVTDLVEWTQELLERMTASKAALVTGEAIVAVLKLDGLKGLATSADPKAVAWSDQYLSAGTHCTKTFCKATGFCPKLEKQAMDAAGVWFDDIGEPRLANMPGELSPEHAARVLDAADMMEGWINAVRAYWHAQAEAGVEIPDHILVPKVGREAWFSGRDVEAAGIAIAAGLPQDKVYNDPKIKTPKQVREALKKAKLTDAITKLEGMSGAESKGTNLVRADKTSREAVKPAVHQFFDVLN